MLIRRSVSILHRQRIVISAECFAAVDQDMHRIQRIQSAVFVNIGIAQLRGVHMIVQTRKPVRITDQNSLRIFGLNSLVSLLCVNTGI